MQKYTCFYLLANIIFSFFKYILLIMLLQLSYFFSSLSPSALHSPPSNIPSPPQFMYMGRTYKFLGFSISYVNLLVSIMYQPFVLLILCSFSSIPPSPSPLLTLHVMPISVILFLCQLLAYFVFVFVSFWGSVVDSCEFVVI